ncbi:MAG TPA: oxidoreductase [Motilibacteraceae bacterium]|nr:oxidoreductase [Motilibacteraceae bacterium]
MSWSATDIPDQTGRTVVVTGANSGLGYHASAELARRGARVVMACRDAGRGAEALARLRTVAPTAPVVVEPLDLASLASVRDFSDRLSEQFPDGIDVLLNNAGVMATPPRKTADGFELQLGTNHLGHFALTGLVLPLLLRRPGARVVTVSSQAHRMGRIDFSDLMSERKYQKWRAYGQSKLANLLFAFELARRAEAAGLDLKSVAAHPGYANTNLQAVGPRMAGNSLMEKLTGVANVLFGQPAADGALPELYAATMPDVRTGEFFGPSGFAETRGTPKRVASSAAAQDLLVAERLWAESERLTGVTYEALRPAA